MGIKHLKLINFRNYSASEFTFNKQLNFISGPNGTGKTTILEAIHFLALTKSFRSNVISNSLQNNADYFQIFGKFSTDKGQIFEVNLNYTKKGGKRVLVDKEPLKRDVDMIGKIPLIVLAPGSMQITAGGPAVKRDFINRILSLIDRDYLNNLIEYNRRITQRNKLLNKYREQRKKQYDTYLQTLDELLVKPAVYIHKTRQYFIDQFNPVFQQQVNKISHFNYDVVLQIKFNVTPDSEPYEKTFKKRLYDNFFKDCKLGWTTCGPHLDKLEIKFNKNNIKRIASQGEHKVVLIALKMAEGYFIEKEVNKSIIYLLDDLFSLLDAEHCWKIVREIGHKNQTFVTTTDMAKIRDQIKFNGEKVQLINLPVGEA